MKGSSMKRIRLYVLNTFPLLYLVLCSAAAGWSHLPLCICNTERGTWSKVTISIGGKPEDHQLSHSTVCMETSWKSCCCNGHSSLGKTNFNQMEQSTHL